MPPFGFKDRYVDQIVRGTKISTIHRTQRAKVGDMCNLYARLRTKQSLCLATVEIADVDSVVISSNGIRVD